jgi:hypothetical protein
MEYVDFDMAKKLKEKGFSEICSHYYRTKSKDLFMIFPCEDWSNIEERVNAPTISQVLKWLRNEKDIFIQLEYINQKACGCTIIKQKTGGVIAKWNYDKFQYVNKNPLVGNTYEQAAIAGIEYVLDNLI